MFAVRDHLSHTALVPAVLLCHPASPWFGAAKYLHLL